MRPDEADAGRLWTMLLTAESLIRRTADLTAEELVADEYHQWAVSKAVELIGEGAYKLSKPFKAANPEVPWDRMTGMRHLIVHDYAKVDWSIVHDTIRRRIPELVAALRPLLPVEPSESES